MSLGDAAFLGAVHLPPLVLGSAMVAIVRLPVGRTRRIHAVAGALCAAVLTGASASTFWWWGIAFDQVEAEGVVTAAVDRALVISFWVAVVASVCVPLVGLTAVLARRRLIPGP